MAEKIFQDRLVEARKRLGWSQDRLADEAGLVPAAISHLETGRRKPSFHTLKKLAEALKVSADYLLGRVGTPTGHTDSSAAFRDALNELTQEQRDFAMRIIEDMKKQRGQ